MKRNLSNFTDREIENIEEWIKEKRWGCPDIKCENCKAMFPKLPEVGINTLRRRWGCPCNAFDREYVVEIARKIVKESRS